MKTEIRNLLHRYPISAAYSAEDECYVARVTGFPHVGAHGDTPAKAVKEATVALEGALESLIKRSQPLPEGDPFVAELRRMRPFLNITSIAKAAGLPVTTVKSRIKNGTAFSDKEVGRIHDALTLAGV